MGHGLAADFPAEYHADLGGAELSGHHQGIPLSPAPDRLLDPAMGMLQVALVDLRLDSPTFGRRNTMYVGTCGPGRC